MSDTHDEGDEGALDVGPGPLLGENNDSSRSSRRARKATVKLTGYRLLNMATIFTFGMVKAVLTYLGQSAAPTTIDWIAGVVLTIALYYIGLHEAEHSPDWNWFFDEDLSHLVGYYYIRAILIFIGTFLFCLAMIITIPYGVSLYVLGLLTYLSLAVGLNALTLILAMLATVTLGVTGFTMCRLLTRRVLIRRSARATWLYIARGQSRPNRFPWWLDAFTIASSATLAFLFQWFWLHDFLFNLMSHLMKKAPDEKR